MISTKKYPDEDVNRAIKRLKRKMIKENTLQELRDRSSFKSEGQKRREVKKHAAYVNSFNKNN